MALEIRCDNGAGRCGKLLGKAEGATLTIVCPRCGRPHVVPILALVQELTAFLAEIEAKAGQNGAGGFML